MFEQPFAYGGIAEFSTAPPERRCQVDDNSTTSFKLDTYRRPIGVKMLIPVFTPQANTIPASGGVIGRAVAPDCYDHRSASSTNR